jgi:hypothetical protein
LGGNLKSRRHYIKYVVLVGLLMTAFQNCGKLESTSVSDGANSGLNSFFDTDLALDASVFLLKEEAPNEISTVNISLKPDGSQSVTYQYTLKQENSDGSVITTTALGSMTGTVTLTNPAMMSSPIKLSLGSANFATVRSLKIYFEIEKLNPQSNLSTFNIPVMFSSNVVEPPPPPPPPPNEALLRQQRCKSYTSKPGISSLAATTTTMQYGQSNQALEGNKNGSPIEINANAGITNASGYAADNCVTIQTLQVRCAVVTGDATKPASITNAISNAGEDRLAELRASILAANPTMSATDVARQAQETIAGGAFVNNNNCQVQFGQGLTKTNITINPQYNNNGGGFRCVEGSFWIRVTIRSEVAGINPAYDSDPQYIKVNVNNGCWKEYRLKDVNNVNPKIPNVANLGSDVAINGNWAASLAESENNDPNLKVGAIYLFKKEAGNWNYKQKLMIPQSTTSEAIQSVAIRGDYIVLGNPRKAGIGAIYLYKRESNDVWSMVGSGFSPAGLGANASFGRSVALTATQVFVGAPGENSAYSFDYDSSGIISAGSYKWSAANGKFGQSVAVDGTSLAVGAPGTGAQTGSVSVFNTTTKSELKKVNGTDPGEQFGSKVSIRGNMLAVTSAAFYTNANPEVGRVTFYKDFTTAPATKTFEGGNASAILGSGVVLAQDGIYFGTPQNGQNVGQVIYLKYTDLDGGAVASYRLRALNESANSRFGWSVAVDGGNVIIGARTKNEPGDNNGASYIYELK